MGRVSTLPVIITGVLTGGTFEVQFSGITERMILLKASFHIAANCLQLLPGSLTNMETYLASIATTVLQPPYKLREVQPSQLFRYHRQDNLLMETNTAGSHWQCSNMKKPSMVPTSIPRSLEHL